MLGDELQPMLFYVVVLIQWSQVGDTTVVQLASFTKIRKTITTDY